jgi:hypothetical protein
VAAALVAAAVEAAASPATRAAAGETAPGPAGEPAPVPAGETAPASDAPGGGDGAPQPATAVGQETVEADSLELAGNGHGTPEESERAVVGAERPVEVPRATPRPATAAAGATPARRPAQPARVAGSSATVPPRRTTPAAPRGRARPEPGPARRGHGRGVLIGVLAGVLVLAAAALAITQLGGGSDPAPKPNTTEPNPTSTSAATTGSGAPSKADTTVVILNGTSTDGLAAKAKDQLLQAGYASDHLPTSNAANSATAQSTVYYASGRRQAGLSVARALDVNAVEPITPDIQTLADNSSDPPVKADVVVVLGADRTP